MSERMDVRDCPTVQARLGRVHTEIEEHCVMLRLEGAIKYRLDVYARAQVTNRPRLAPKNFAVQNICAIPFFNVSCLEFRIHYHSRL